MRRSGTRGKQELDIGLTSGLCEICSQSHSEPAAQEHLQNHCPACGRKLDTRDPPSDFAHRDPVKR